MSDFITFPDEPLQVGDPVEDEEKMEKAPEGAPKLETPEFGPNPPWVKNHGEIALETPEDGAPPPTFRTETLHIDQWTIGTTGVPVENEPEDTGTYQSPSSRPPTFRPVREVKHTPETDYGVASPRASRPSTVG